MDENEDLKTWEPDQIAARLAEIKAEGDAILAGPLTVDKIDELTKLADEKDLLDKEQDRRVAEDEKLAADAAALAERLNPPVAEADPEDEATESDTEDEPEDTADVDEDEKVLVAAGAAPVRPKRPAVGAGKALTARRPKAAEPKTADAAPFMSATGHALSPEGTKFTSTFEIAKAIVAKQRSLGLWEGARQNVSIATAEKPAAAEITGDPFVNFAVLRSVADQMGGSGGLVASGTACAPLTPSYEFFRLAQAQSPVENVLPVVQAPRGGIRYLPGTGIDANAASTLDLSSQSRVYTGSTVQNVSGPKSCARATCPSPVDALVSAVSQCVTFDNLQYRAFPELVEKFLADVGVMFAEKKEVFYLDYINTNSTAVTADYGYGASRNLLGDWTDAARLYRKRQRMARNSTMQVLAPDWAMDSIKLDMADDPSLGLNYFSITDAQVEAAFRTFGLKVDWYNDNPTGVSPSQKANGAQSAGAILRAPVKVFAYVYAPGTFVRLDGGSLDVGLVRDSILNGTNDLQLFMEEWIGMAMLGIESLRVQSQACYNGAAAPAASALRTCP